MAEIKKIMVAVAFSPYSKGIFNYAAQLATRLDTDLVVASIINERDVSAVQRISDMGCREYIYNFLKPHPCSS